MLNHTNAESRQVLLTFYASGLSVGRRGSVPLYIGRLDQVPNLSWPRGVAKRMLQLFGLSYREGDLCGHTSIHFAMRAITYVKSNFDRIAPSYVIQDDAYFVGGNLVGGGLDVDGIRDRVEQFTEFTVFALCRGAKSLYWRLL